MQYEDEFERDFMQRTLEIVRQYRGAFDATLLINSLLGLLIIPSERTLNKIPEDPIGDLEKWGISPTSILSFGKTREQDERPETLRLLVRRLRNAVAHFRIKPIHTNRVIEGFDFSDRNGFKARIKLVEVKVFVEKIASHLEKQYVG